MKLLGFVDDDDDDGVEEEDGNWMGRVWVAGEDEAPPCRGEENAWKKENGGHPATAGLQRSGKWI